MIHNIHHINCFLTCNYALIISLFFEAHTPYGKVSSDNCTSLGMSLVRTKEECELAATMLGLSDTTASSAQLNGRPHGCIYASNGWLNWYEPIGSPYPSVSCGSSFSDGSYVDLVKYDCLCSKPGET